MRAASGEWKAAIDLGTRLGRIPEPAAVEALRRLQEAGEAASDQVATWISLPPSETEALCALACAMLGTEPTLVTPKPDSDAATMKVGPNATMRLAPEAAPTPGVPKRLGPYELIEELGHGGMGVVYRARHTKLGSLCAVKVLLSGEFASTEAIARFQREAAAVAKMGKHPNLVAVHDLGQEGGLVYYAMELVEGKSLRQRMREGDVPLEESVVVVEKVARAVHFAHAHGVIHRDLKPENVMLRTDGEPQVMDFGLAREVGSEERLSVAGQIMGTLAYMAPEQARGDVEAMDARTDVYALGGVLYELLTGVPPHPGKTPAVLLPAILRGEIVPPRRHRPEVPRDLENVCMKALAFEPPRRYAGAEAFAEDLARFRRGEPVAARPVGRMARLARRVRRHPLVSGLIAASALLGVVLLWRFAGPARVRLATKPHDARVETVGRTLWGGGWVWPAGEFTIRVSAPGHDPKEVKVDLAAGAMRDLGTITLDVDHGYLKVDSDPPGARVIIDETDMEAFTPAERLAVPNGQHVLHLHLADHSDHIASVVIEAEKTRDLGKVRLVHHQGTLAVGGAPVGMTVGVLDAASGKEVARLSPPVILPFATGRYDLVGRKNGWFEHRTRVDVREGEETCAFLPLSEQLLWTFAAKEHLSSPPALSDLDGDGLLDAVVCSGFEVIALSGADGSPLWSWFGNRVWHGPAALGDMDEDGTSDVAVSGRDELVVLSGRSGSPLWEYAPGDWFETEVRLADLDGDGLLDLVAGCADRKVCVVSGKTHEAVWSQDMGEEFNYGPGPSVGDLSGDGRPDVVLATRGGRVLAFSGQTGAILWEYGAESPIHGAPAIGDLEGDGRAEVVVGCEDGRVHVIDGTQGRNLWTHDGRGAIHVPMALGDLDRDGVLDFVYGTWNDRLGAVSGKDRRELWTVEATEDFDSNIELGDLDGDGGLDVVTGTRDGRVIAVGGADGGDRWEFDCAHARGCAVLGDINGDGVLECVIGSEDRNVYALAGKGLRSVWGTSAGSFIVDAAEALADIDGDGVLDVITDDSGGDVRGLSWRDHRVLWTNSEISWFDGPPCVADFNGDGRPDAVGPCREDVFAVSCATGEVLWSRDLGSDSCVARRAVDLDGDGEADIVSGTEEGRLLVMGGRGGETIWSIECGAEVSVAPLVTDLDGDGVAEILVGLDDGKLIVVSGEAGAPRWSVRFETPIDAELAAADLDSDGVLDCIVAEGESLHALSGRDGKELWDISAPNSIEGGVSLVEADGDDVLDVLVLDGNETLAAISGREGLVLWTRKIASLSFQTPAVGDLDGDGRPELAVGTTAGNVWILDPVGGISLAMTQVMATSRSTVARLVDLDGDGRFELLAHSDDARTEGEDRIEVLALPPRASAVPSDPLASLARARRAHAWRTLEARAEKVLKTREDRATRRVAWRELGIARLWLGRPQDALKALREARALGLRPGEAAAYEAVAAWTWAECPEVERTESGEVLVANLRTSPDAVFDAFVDLRDRLGESAIAGLRGRILTLSEDEDSRVWAAVLLTIANRSGSRPLFDAKADADRVWQAYGDIVYLFDTAGNRLARLVAYLALIDDALDYSGDFSKAYETYKTLPNRPPSLDRLLFEAYCRRGG